MLQPPQALDSVELLASQPSSPANCILSNLPITKQCALQWYLSYPQALDSVELLVSQMHRMVFKEHQAHWDIADFMCIRWVAVQLPE